MNDLDKVAGPDVYASFDVTVKFILIKNTILFV